MREAFGRLGIFLIIHFKILPSQTHHTLDDLILAIVLLHLQEVVAEVEDVKSPLLSKEHNDHAACPMEAVPEALPAEQRQSAASQTWPTCLLIYSLHCKLVRSHRNAVHELHGAPETVELHTLVDVHHSVARQRPAPDLVVQEGAHPS